MNHDTMADLLFLRANHLTWSTEEREQLIADALNCFMSRRRKLKLGDRQRSFEPPRKMVAISSDDSVSQMESDFNDDDSESPDSDCDSNDDIRDYDVRDADTDSDLDASDIDSAEEDFVATVLQSTEESMSSDNECNILRGTRVF